MVNALIKKLAYRTLFLSGFQKKLLTRIIHRHFVVILSLHRISPQRYDAWPALKPNLFESLLIYLKKHFEITTFHELKNQTSTKPKLVLSFDDGYYDFLEYAMPILKKHKLRANLNIIPSQLINDKPLWNIALYDFINAAPPNLLNKFHIPGIPALKKYRHNKTMFGLVLSRSLKKLPFSERDLLINELHSHYYSQLEPYPKTRMLKLCDMPQIIAEHEIGVHSYSHNSMGEVDMNYFIEDFSKCRDFFRENKFPPMDIYAFPNGSYRDEQIDYLKQNDIKHILLVDDKYSTVNSPYPRLHIAAADRYEAIFQSLGIKQKGIEKNHVEN